MCVVLIYLDWKIADNNKNRGYEIMASELVIQLQNGNGDFSCEKYDNLPSSKSAYIAICFTDNYQSEQYAISLKKNLINFIKKFESSFNIGTPPCGGQIINFGHCKSLSILDNLKLLIVVSDGTSNNFINQCVLNWSHNILPVFPFGKSVNLPDPFNKKNAIFWKKDIDEVLPFIIGKIGISTEDQKIFISYRRTETESIAIQLFNRLSHEGFDVFLDRFSIEPAVNFQVRLYQELADKAMVVFLESPDFLNSEWIKLEVAFAKQYRLGLLALNIDNAPKIQSIDDEFRMFLTKNLDFIYQELTSQAIDNLIVNIKYQHSIALYRKKNYLSQCVLEALKHKGFNPVIDKNGFIDVSNNIKNVNYKIWSTPRPPKINDYHHTDISNNFDKKIIVGPEFMENDREVLNNWLSQKTAIDFYNEGQILELSNLA